MAFEIHLTPHGRLLVSHWGDEIAVDMTELESHFAESSARGLLSLAGMRSKVSLSPALGWWREFAQSYFIRLCHTPGLECGVPPALPEPVESDLNDRASKAPLMRGLEYLNASVLADLWKELDLLVQKKISAFPEGAAAWLHKQNPAWSLLGKVTFHLAENKRNLSHPFAFLATYTHSLSSQSKAQHLPLGNAFKQYAEARDKPTLLKLLTPVQKAAEKSSFMRKMVDSGEVFRPLAWTPRQAHHFLCEVPILEESGLIIRIPNWWNPSAPPRAKVEVRIGNAATTGMGAKTLLDFSVGVTLDGQTLTEEDLKSLLDSSEETFVLLKGKWVEVDHLRLKEAMEHWKSVEKMAAEDGLSFSEGMRLLAKTGITHDDPAEVISDQNRSWSEVVAGDWLAEALARLRDPSQAANNVLTTHPNLKTDLRHYQQTGVQWLWFMKELGLGACLADDMGLGKTIQILALLLHFQRNHTTKSPSLLVVPASLMANWRAEAARFAPDLQICFAHPAETPSDGLVKLASKVKDKSSEVDLVVTTYGMILRLAWLKEVRWYSVILDEAQAIKNPASRQTRSVKELRSDWRVVLTGTPVENHLSDLWSIFDFLNPGLLGSTADFSRYSKNLRQSDPPDYGPLRTLVRPYILRRLKSDKNIIKDLPDKTELRAFCGLSRRQAALYQRSVDELARKIDEVDGIQRRGLILAYLTRFKQICNHPSQWIGDRSFAPEDSGKFNRLKDLCEEVSIRQEKTLVFTQFREMTEPLFEFLTTVFGQSGQILHGGTPVKERRKLVESFQREDGPPFFILSLKAGGSGLNLTQASHVIHFDRWWNPAVENQATDRAYRIGQRRNVLVHKFICRGTVEEKIDKLIEEKRGMAEQFLSDEGVALLTEMKNDELLRFVSLDIGSALGDENQEEKNSQQTTGNTKQSRQKKELTI
jgi:non-specific serine/threonine protein kinase